MSPPTESPSQEQLRKGLVEKLRGQHPNQEVLGLELGGHFFVIRGPARDEYKRFREYVMTPSKRVSAGETLVADCLLHPEKEAAGTLFARKPGFVDVLAEAVLQAAGGGEQLEKKPY